MAENTAQNKTEEATPRRLEQARGDGQVALSSDLSSAVMLCVATLALIAGGAAIASELSGSLREGLGSIAPMDWSVASTQVTLQWALGRMVACCGWFVAVLFAAGLAVATAQAGWQVSFKPLSPDWSRLSPTTGWSRLLSIASLIRGGFAILKVATILLCATIMLSTRIGEIQFIGRHTLASTLASSWHIALATAALAVGAALVLGGTDYIYQWFKHRGDLKMSRQELKDEQKQEEGDPHVRGRIRKLQRDSAQNQMLREVPDASVVVTNPTHFAVALRYDRGEMEAPRVVAKGVDGFARRIIRTAREADVPVIERKPLARALYASAEPGDPIPLELYHAVAEILAYVYRQQAA